MGVLFNVGPRIGKYTKDGLTRVFRPHNLHITALGLMLIFTGFYAFYGACLVIASTSFPGWANIYLSPTTLGSITMVITMGFAGGFTGGYFASRGDPFWTISGRPGRRDRRLGGRRRLRADARVADLDADRRDGRLHRRLDRDEDARRRRRRGGGRARLLGLPRDPVGRRLRRRLPDGPQQRREQHRRPADGRWRRSCRSASCRAGSRRSSSRSSTSCACRWRSSSRAWTWPSTRPTSTPSTPARPRRSSSPTARSIPAERAAARASWRPCNGHLPGAREGAGA